MADFLENAHGASPMPADTRCAVAAGRAEVVEESRDDDAVRRDVPPVGERPSASLQGMPGETAHIVVVTVTMGREVGAAEDIVNGLFDAFAARTAQESENLLLDLLSCHVFSLGCFSIYTAG